MDKFLEYLAVALFFFPTIGVSVLGMGYGMYRFLKEGR